MEGIIFLIISAFFFAVIGVIALLVRTYRQGERLQKYERRLTRLEEALGSLAAGTAAAEAEIPAEAPDGEAPAPENAAGLIPPEPEAAASLPAADMSLRPARVWTPMEAPPVPAPEAPEEAFPPSAPESPAAGKTPRAWADTVQPPAPPSSGPGKTLAAFIRGGNLWAAGGIILLLAGFATLITYLASRGFFTVEMGIAAAAITGLAMLAAGWRFRKKRPRFFRLLQGGGIGILYLSVFAAHKLTPWFPALITLVLFSVLVLQAVVLALFQKSQALALMGFLGGFAAPPLLASGGGNHVFLFAYYGVLNLGVLGIGLFRPWRGLKLLAFLATFILANLWTAQSYRPPLFRQVEPFFLAYIVIFTILGVHGLRGKIVRNLDLTLILGTPGLGALLQWQVFRTVPHGYALICIAFSAFYILLALCIWKRLGTGTAAYSEAYLAFAAGLANLAVPLELAPRITSAVWAAEGAAAFLLGSRLKSRKTLTAGLILHLAAAVAFVVEGNIFAWGEGAFRSVRFTGSLVIALSGLAMVWIAHRSPPFPEKQPGRPLFPVYLEIWALAWWFGGWWYEIYRTQDNPLAVTFLFCSASALAAFGGAKFLRVPPYRLGMIPAPILGFFIPLAVFLSRIPGHIVSRPWLILSHNFFQDLFLWAWPVFFALQALLLYVARKDLREDLHGLWLLTVVLTGLAVLSSSGRALTLAHNLAPAWTSFAGMAPLFITMTGIGLLAPRFILRGEASPLATDLLQGNKSSAPPLSGGEPPQRPPVFSSPAAGFRKKLFLFVLPLTLSCVMGLWFFVTLFLSGDPAPLPYYIPLINPLDLEEIFCVLLFLLWQSVLLKQTALPRPEKPALFVLLDAAVFLFAIAVTARCVHFYGGVPYHRVFQSDLFHLCLFILWAVYGIGHIIGGYKLARRKVWIAGAVLMVADIAKLLILDLAGTGAVTRIISFFVAGILLLFIGWVAPLPPREEKALSPGAGERHER
jgi:uncharacterized membrane protein